ncbi:MAG: hypothetical protein ACNS62_15840 [Candidatus Cyclobacteriaceae bacterium M3_2C_046]
MLEQFEIFNATQNLMNHTVILVFMAGCLAGSFITLYCTRREYKGYEIDLSRQLTDLEKEVNSLENNLNKIR